MPRRWNFSIALMRKRGELTDLLILLEHPPVFTLGRNTKDSMSGVTGLSETGGDRNTASRERRRHITDLTNWLSARFLTKQFRQDVAGTSDRRGAD
jgi:hypothetical protein